MNLPILLLQDIIFSSVEVIPKNFPALKSFGYSLDDAKCTKSPVQRLPVEAVGSDPGITSG